MGCVNGKPVLNAEDLDYIANHTAVSREEVEQSHKNFLEAHPDGKITKSDFRKMMQACYPSTDTEKLESHIFRMYDTNEDGYIDFREFMIVLYTFSNGTPEENLNQMFRVFDINSDGSVSLKELLRIVKALHILFKNDEKFNQTTPEDLADDAFKEMDTNTDGKISREEFVNACLKHEKISKMLALSLTDIFL